MAQSIYPGLRMTLRHEVDKRNINVMDCWQRKKSIFMTQLCHIKREKTN